MLSARSCSISIRKEADAVYELIWHPEFFSRWASGLSESAQRKHGEQWLAEGPEGPTRIRFTPHNGFGVMDHFVDTGDSAEAHVPLRVVTNGEGSEVIFTRFRQPDIDEERFSADIKLVNRDLKALKRLIESSRDAS